MKIVFGNWLGMGWYHPRVLYISLSING